MTAVVLTSGFHGVSAAGLHCLNISVEDAPVGLMPPADVALVWTVYTPGSETHLISRSTGSARSRALTCFCSPSVREATKKRNKVEAYCT